MKALANQNLGKLCYELLHLDTSTPEGKLKHESALKSFVKEVDTAIAMDKFAKSQEQMLRDEIEFLDKEMKKYKNLQKQLRDVAYVVLSEMGVKSLETETGRKISIGESYEVVIKDHDALPEWARRKVEEIVPKKIEIKEALREGTEVPGAELKRNVSVSFR